MKQPRLRDSRKLSHEFWPLGLIPLSVIHKFAAGFVYRLYCGHKDITGDDWGDIFAEAIGGVHLAKPLGLSDIVTDSTAWSAKTVKSKDPFSQQTVRLISGRNSPDYSYGIEDPHENIQDTGDAVLGIWNGRVDIAQAHHSQLRSIVLLRNYDCTEFVVYEEYLEHFNISEYEWRENPQANLEGFNKLSGAKWFTWQPHGSQFSIHSAVPCNAIKFRVKRPPVISQEDVLHRIGFSESWVEIL